jgi:hypothetical protein
MFEPPYPAYDPSDRDGFSWETVVHRWPKILTGVVDQLVSYVLKGYVLLLTFCPQSRENHNLFLHKRDAAPSPDESDRIDSKIAEGQKIIETVSRLKYEMGRDYELWLVPNDGEFGVSTFNDELNALREISKNTWMTAPW